MTLSDPINFGGVIIDGNNGGNSVDDYDAFYVPGSLKSIQNGVLSVQEIPGRAQEWQVEIKGSLSGGNMDSEKTSMEDWFRDGEIRGLLDGEHDGNYVITALKFPRNNMKPTVREYIMTIRQYTQTLPN